MASKDMTPNALSNLFWVAVIIAVGIGFVLVGLGVAEAIAIGVAFIATPIIWFALFLLLYWPYQP